MPYQAGERVINGGVTGYFPLFFWASADLVVVHGETMAEPVVKGTNRAAVDCEFVDVLAHPGFITLDEARIATANGVHLELTSRRGHSLTNGHGFFMSPSASNLF